ncbi:MAG: glycoside hydrolase family 28 protein [Acutalibacteraceae bacterium]
MNISDCIHLSNIRIFSTVSLIIIGLFSGFLSSPLHSKETIGKTETQYKTDKTGSKIENIPFSKYIKNCSLEKEYITAQVNENNSGEENSAAISKAIDALGSEGGTVYIPAGEYKISSVELKSNITLFISQGAKLISLDCDENLKSESPIKDGVIVARNAENVAVTGGGTINGQGLSYTDEAKTDEPLYALKEFNTYTRVIEARKRIRFGKKDIVRNSLISLNNCKNAYINNIVLEESASWTLVINGGNGYNIHNIVIDNHMHVANSDGIDILNCSDVNIRKCFIATGDDGIVIKPRDGAVSDVRISDCEVCSFANCFKIGTETAFDVENVNLENCRFFIPDGMTYGYSGIAIESADGSNISDIHIDNVDMDGVSSPILIWLGNRLRFGNDKIGSIDNISISNINAENVELPSAITGCKADGKVYSIGKVELKNINVKYRDTQENLSVLSNVPEKSMSDYPDIVRVSHIYFISHELSGYWDLPCYGLFIRYADIDYSDFSCTARSCNTREFVSVTE